jgi:hypothetical protein
VKCKFSELLNRSEGQGGGLGDWEGGGACAGGGIT